ncbi:MULTISPECIES: S-layer family protein [unclassified Nostoc]|uniref:beta strand repeat-containing protein n=1 Tax=unclassified Nostoc TaxID=2593658 RepID=UPI002AD23AB1|nr:S-layer family protein [Nostoc sp. DedQUE03]MDZ7973551.1 S-layer family protein [Nostoc sp. DedQUE03]MDZ8049422.1 S-layer family protein [Nostoc sp. DedQUE02]
MTIKYGLHKCLQFGLAGLLGCLSVSLFTSKIQAQQSNIVPDNTLGAESSQVIGNFQGLPIEVITGGATRQINLFHSFQEFNINEGRGAYFFSPSADIQNILARVTGNNPSEILGTLGTFGNSSPNLFLINPNGIVFGKNASLDVQGSFVGTTANGIQFGNQGVFSATNPQAVPLLTINPSVLLFNQIKASGGIINQSQAPAGTNLIGEDVTGLQVADGKSLLLVGGNINIDGGSVHAYGGNIELAGLAAPGNVGLNIAGDNLSLVIPEDVERADVSLSNGAEVNVRGAGGGNITIQARNVNLAGQSILRAGIDTGLGTPNSKGGDITINATGDTTLIDGSAIANVVQERAFGKAGDINIATGTLTLQNAGQINANLYGQGNAGNVNINAQGDVTVTGQKDDLVSRISNLVFTGATGNSGNINIKSSSFTLSNDASLSTSIFGQGNGGNISIQTSDAVELARGLIFTNIESGGVGNGGEINITAGSLSLTDSSQIQSQVEGFDNQLPGGRGNAGNININVQGNISFRNSTLGESSGIVSEVVEGAIGNGANVTINTNSFEINDGSVIESSTRGKGNSGNIIINARNNISLDGRSGNIFSHIINAVQATAEGNAGNIQITTGTLKASNGAFISSSSFGKGNAGNISINALDNIDFDNDSFVNTNVYNQGVSDGENIYLNKGGNIEITTGSLSVKNSARISSVTTGGANAGNITINARDTVTSDGGGNDLFTGVSTSGLDNSTGNAGNIRINAGGLFIKNGATLSAFSSGQGNAGNIFIDTRDAVTFDGTNSNNSLTGAISSAIGSGNGGNIQVKTGGTLTLRNGGVIFTDANRNAGNINIDTNDAVIIDGISGTFSYLSAGGVGKGGNIEITTNSLTLSNGGQLSASSFGKGNAGDIIVNAGDAIGIDGVSSNGRSGVFTSLQGEAEGNGGNINLTTSSLFLTNGGRVSGSTFSIGNGGNITIDARDRIFIDGVSTTGYASGLFSTVNQDAVGNAGNINLTTDSLFLNRGGISSSSFGQGKAGDININSGSTALDNQAAIAAITNSGDGGNINLTASDRLLLRNGSQISTTAGTAQSGGDGGNIDIDSRFIIAIPKENSDIAANAFTGTGGKVEINSQGVFGIESRTKPTEKSDITASSELGVSGVININAPDTSTILNSFTELSPVIDANALIANSCISRGTKRQENSFTITGSGALTTNRPGVLVSNYTTGEVRGVETTSHSWKKGDPIIEPTGVYRLNNGQLLLSRECSN